MLVSSVQTVVAWYAAAPRICTLVLFIYSCTIYRRRERVGIQVKVLFQVMDNYKYTQSSCLREISTTLHGNENVYLTCTFVH